MWQTPVADDAVERKAGKWNSRGEPKLSAQVMWPTPHGFSPDGRSNGPSGNELGWAVNRSLFPTPTALDHFPAHTPEYIAKKRAEGHGMSNLNDAIAMWPTPTGTLGTKGGAVTPNKGRDGGTLVEALSLTMWPTPTAVTDTGGAALCKWGGSGARAKLRTMVTPQELNGSLNPTWVEWLMGWPLGWTDLQPSATDKYRNARRKPGDF